MRNVHFMHRNKPPFQGTHHNRVPTPRPCRAVTLTDDRIAAMRTGGMSIRAIRRALGLSEVAATAAGLLASGRLVAASTPGGDATNPRGPGGPRMPEVLDAVSRGTGIDREALIAPGQRQLVMYLIRELCPGASLQAIGFLLDRDHTTVLYGCQRAAALLDRDRAFRETYLRARRALIHRLPEPGSGG